MGEFRKVWQIRALPDLRPQEKELLEKAEAGELLILGDGELPSASDESRSIRAGIIRYLLLGGCEALRCHEKGVQIQGALIPDELDLAGCDADNSLILYACRFEKALVLASARLRGINLDGAICPGINGDRLRLRENLHLRRGFHATGTVEFPGAVIGGVFDGNNATFNNKDGIALFADGLKTGGDIALSGGFVANGEVRLLGAEIGGDLNCTAGTFSNEGGFALNADGLKVERSISLSEGFHATGEVGLLGAAIGGDLACSEGTFSNVGGNALDAYKAQIGGTLFWRKGVKAKGIVEVSGASCAELNDDWGDWPEEANSISLNGFTYGSISGNGTVDASTRLKWLALDNTRWGFCPQPYQQLAKVLREMGHNDDARKVMVAKEKLQRADLRQQQRKRIDAASKARDISNRLVNPRTEMLEGIDRERMLYRKLNPVEQDFLRNAVRHSLARPGGDSESRKAREGLDPTSRALGAQSGRNDMLWEIAKARVRIGLSYIVQHIFGALIGFGYRPMRAVWTVMAMLLLGWWLFAETWNAGDVTPNSAPILVSKAWTDVEHLPHPAEEWTAQARAGRDYETFNALAYSFDDVVPLIDLGQESA